MIEFTIRTVMFLFAVACYLLSLFIASELNDAHPLFSVFMVAEIFILWIIGLGVGLLAFDKGVES